MKVKLPVHEAGHSPPPSAEVKNEWSYTSAPLICFHSVDRENLPSLFCRFVLGAGGSGGWVVLRIGLLM